MLQRGSLWAAACVLSLVLFGCLERDTGRIGPEVGFGQQVFFSGSGVTEVDVLFVVDTSGSMVQERANLAVQIPALVRDLASPPDRNSDGMPDWNPAQSLRIGVITTDVGTGSITVEGSNCEPNGDDGRLVSGGIFEWTTGDDPEVIAASVRDVVMGLSGNGCAFEQPLEAAARAMTHAEETGFPREDGLLALVLVTDEDDCSIENDEAFFSRIAPAEANIHCAKYRGDLTPNDQLLARIQGARDPYNFVFAAITGIPRDARDTTPTALLNHAGMQDEFIDAPGPGLIEVREACEYTPPGGVSLGQAAPARKIVEFSALIPDSVLTTICTDDFGPAVREIGERVGARVPGVCLVRELPNATGEVPCETTVTLPEGQTCASFPGYSDAGTDGGRAVCAIAQVAEGSGESGFYYDADNEECAQLVFTELAIPPIGSNVNAECFFPLLRPNGEQCARASQCESGFCDQIVRTCAPAETVDGPGDLPTGP